MISILAEATLRSVGLFGAVWLLLKVIRLRDLRAEKLIWTLVVLISLAMPVLMRSFALPLPAPQISIQVVGKLSALTAAQGGTFGFDWVVGGIYVLVTSVLLARFARGLWVAARVRRTSRRIPLDRAGKFDVRVSQRVRAPLSFGSTILLPVEWEAWEPRVLRAVLAHESAHVRECDCYRLWLVTLYGALFWFNPTTIWLRRRLTDLAETISDDAAVPEFGDRIGYAQVLVSLAAEAQFPKVALAMALPSNLTPRLKRLLESHMTPSNLRLWPKITLITVVVLTAATSACAATTPLVLTDAQDSAVKWVSGEPMGKFYPKALQKNHTEGTVVCRVTISARGQVTKVVAVGDTNNPDLAVAAVKTVKSFHFNNTLARPVIKMLAVKFALS